MYKSSMWERSNWPGDIEDPFAGIEDFGMMPGDYVCRTLTQFSRFMPRLIFLMQVSRPILWPLLPMVYFLGVHSAGAAMTAAASVLQMVLLTLPMNLIGCGLNDIYDVESDRQSERRRAIWGAEVKAGRCELRFGGLAR